MKLKVLYLLYCESSKYIAKLFSLSIFDLDRERTPYLNQQCRPLCRNLGSRVHFLVKVILIDFQLEKYMQCKEKDVCNFFLQY